MHRWTGRLCGFFYKLNHHTLGSIALVHWLWIGMLVSLVVALLGRLAWGYAISLSVSCGLLWIGTQWARQRRYIVFVKTGSQIHTDREIQTRPLKADEPISIWVSGSFGVEGKKRLLLNEPATFSFVPTREHVIMARIKRTRFLLLARSKVIDVGYWYAFFTPERIRRVQLGEIVHKGALKPALSLTYQSEEKHNRENTIYLTFQEQDRQRVLEDLRIDMLQEALETTPSG